MLAFVQALHHQKKHTWHEYNEKLQYDFQKILSCMDKLASQISTHFYIHGLTAHKDKQFHRLKTTLNKSLRTESSRSYCRILRVSGGEAE